MLIVVDELVTINNIFNISIEYLEKKTLKKFKMWIAFSSLEFCTVPTHYKYFSISYHKFVLGRYYNEIRLNK